MSEAPKAVIIQKYSLWRRIIQMNYQRELEKLIERLGKEEKVPRLAAAM